MLTAKHHKSSLLDEVSATAFSVISTKNLIMYHKHFSLAFFKKKLLNEFPAPVYIYFRIHDSFNDKFNMFQIISPHIKS